MEIASALNQFESAKKVFNKILAFSGSTSILIFLFIFKIAFSFSSSGYQFSIRAFSYQPS
ncbi:MAG: hypothetical protein C0168_07720 [Candidatus Aminicenantes bacterium]|nr:MAG: hypothetical protein C0168_07720 [Candidatus Aminicenantes bacterium]